MRILLSVISALICVISSAQLRSGAPVPSGGAEGLAPMSFGLTYACHPIGYAYVSGGQRPDIFVGIRSGMPEAKGLWFCTYQGVTPEGNPIYSQGVKVNTPWDKDKKLPSRLRVFQDGDDVLLLRLTKTRLTVCRYDGKGTFYLESEHRVKGMDESVTSYDCIRRSRNQIEIVLLCNDGARYRPETFKGDTQSYYDGAGIYRGTLPRGGVMSFTVDNDWEQTSGVVSVTADLSTIVAPSEIAALRTSDGKFNGYVISNSQGCLKFVEAGTGNVSYLVDKNKNVIQHRTYSSKLIAYPSVDGARSDLLIGGEGAMYVYENQGGTFDEPNVVLEKNAPVYGGSLTVPNVCDWDGDGDLDIFIGSVKRSSYPSPDDGLPYNRFRQKKYGMQVMLLLNEGTNNDMKFAYPVQLQFKGEDFYLGAHSNAPEPCLLGDTSDGLNLLVGCESGKYYFFEHKDLTYIK